MLSPLVEYLSAVWRPGTTHRLCFPIRQQFIIPLAPPGFWFNFSVAPPVNLYACIKYAATYSEEMPPDCFYQEINQGGDKYVIGYNAPDWQREYMAYFIYFTHADPIYFDLINVSNVNQRFVGTQWLLAIASEDDLRLVQDAMAQYSAETGNKLTEEMVRLLKVLAGEIPRG